MSAGGPREALLAGQPCPGTVCLSVWQPSAGVAHPFAVGRTRAHRAAPHGQDALTGTERLLCPANGFELEVPGGLEVSSAACR